jgi:hypothetical protein
MYICNNTYYLPPPPPEGCLYQPSGCGGFSLNVRDPYCADCPAASSNSRRVFRVFPILFAGVDAPRIINGAVFHKTTFHNTPGGLLRFTHKTSKNRRLCDFLSCKLPKQPINRGFCNTKRRKDLQMQQAARLFHDIFMAEILSSHFFQTFASGKDDPPHGKEAADGFRRLSSVARKMPNHHSYPR